MKNVANDVVGVLLKPNLNELEVFMKKFIENEVGVEEVNVQVYIDDDEGDTVPTLCIVVEADELDEELNEQIEQKLWDAGYKDSPVTNGEKLIHQVYSVGGSSRIVIIDNELYVKISVEDYEKLKEKGIESQTINKEGDMTIKKFKLPVSWQMVADMEIEANTLDEAIDKASEIDSQDKLPEGKYVKHSFEVQRDFIDEDEAEIE